MTKILNNKNSEQSFIRIIRHWLEAYLTRLDSISKPKKLIKRDKGWDRSRLKPIWRVFLITLARANNSMLR